MMKRLLVCVCLLTAQLRAANAQTSPYLEDLTWTELSGAVAAGTTTVIIPAGGTEQNGPLMALGKHNVRVHDLAGRIAVALGKTIVAPVIAYVPEGAISPPTEHMKFPGTLSVPDKVFVQVVEAAARSLKQAGFKDIILIGDHGGYQQDLATAEAALNVEWAKTNVRAHYIAAYYRAQQDDYAQTLVEHGVDKVEIGTHAGLGDTSLMLAIDPHMVRKDELANSSSLGPQDGIYGGSPAHSSAELGQLGVDLIVRQSVDAIRLAIQR